jgi:hypothetical protein
VPLIVVLAVVLEIAADVMLTPARTSRRTSP